MFRLALAARQLGSAAAHRMQFAASAISLCVLLVDIHRRLAVAAGSWNSNTMLQRVGRNVCTDLGSSYSVVVTETLNVLRT